MKIIYNILFTIFFFLSAPYYFIKLLRRGNWKSKFPERFGIYDKSVKDDLRGKNKKIWIHAVSVGEANIAIRLIKDLSQKLPGYNFVISTTTSTGMEVLCKNLPENINKIYYPIDFPFCVNRAVNTISPELIVIVEAEIWPNLLWTAEKRNIPVALVNARLSEKSYRGYKRFGFIFRQLFSKFSAVGCQDEFDRQRLIELGCNPQNITITGNIKFDAAYPPKEAKLDAHKLLKQIGVSAEAPILIGGSTHNGEEEILAKIAQKLRAKRKDLFLILVPRHFERTKEVETVLKNLNMPYILRTEINEAQKISCPPQCLLVNTTGELRDFYRCATVVFVGKSLTAKGGQNPIEPAALGKPIIFGPNMQNFSAIARAFLEGKAAIQVSNADELEKAIDTLLENPEQRKKLGENAIKVIQKNSGAVMKTIDMLCKLIET